MKKIVFIIPPAVELLDLAGPVQVFTEAKFYGYEIDIEFYLCKNNPVSTSGLTFGNMPNFATAQLEEGDFVFIPGMDQSYVRSPDFRKEKKFFKWLKECTERNISVSSVCNGAFALGEAGLLNGIECTTHWRRVNELQRQFPKAKVLDDVLYVKNSRVCTSAGISAGIDLALSILEDLAGTHFTHKVARGLVVYYRGNGSQKQEPSYLDFRNHINVKVHEVQDYLVDNIKGETSIAVLALVAGMSPRNLTRVFKETTGTTINEYLTQIRLDTAKALLQNPKNTMATIASKCGFKTERQLQRILKNGKTLSFEK
jgi:transcriptional regulator GlxA family with amidase domain